MQKYLSQGLSLLMTNHFTKSFPSLIIKRK
nr:MAG TPA: hypothetical protein [Caudoviricetes sp.]